jgi:hypothetical protein
VERDVAILVVDDRREQLTDRAVIFDHDHDPLPDEVPHVVKAAHYMPSSPRMALALDHSHNDADTFERNDKASER